MANFKTVFLTMICIVMSAFCFAQNPCEETVEEKILLVGDSWAFFMDFDATFDQILPAWGHTDKTYYTNATLAENGATLADFLQPEKLDEIEFQLEQKPSIEIIHLSLGGNDFLQNWDISFTDQQTEALKNSVISDLNSLIGILKSYRPDIQIVWSGYAYPNFEEIISSFFIPALHPFYDTWEGMGFPDNESLNLVLNDFSQEVQAIVETDEQLDFVIAPGLMQYVFGQETPLAIPPFGSYPPLDAPLPLGYVDYPSPQMSMRNYNVFLDCFHLSPAGYISFIDYQMQKHYHKALMDDVYFVVENNNLSGSITESTTSTEELIIGNFNNTEHKLLFDFPTENQLEFDTAAAEIFLRIKNQANLTENLSFLVDIQSGFFGFSETIEINDFNFVSETTGEVCFFGEAENNQWLKLSLDATLLDAINNQNQTQIRIALTENSAGFIEFYDASNPDFAPVLNITYGDNPSLSTANQAIEDLTIYPNPTSSKIYFSNPELLSAAYQIKLYDLNGKELKPIHSHGEIDISNFPNGTYIMQVINAKTTMHTKIIKY